MGSFSIWHWLILLAVVLLLFGGSGKISNLMGDVAKGIKSFKKGLADDETKTADDSLKTIEHDVQTSTVDRKSEVKS
ncbi:MAG: twin-arginine translocase TatA/TatE family subunit [Hyphomicrobiales bacterium]